VVLVVERGVSGGGRGDGDGGRVGGMVVSLLLLWVLVVGELCGCWLSSCLVVWWVI